MTVFGWAIAFWLAAGLTAFSLWTVKVYVSSDLAPTSDWTAKIVYRAGQGFIWLAAIAAAGAVFGVMARAVWSLLA